MAIGQVSSGRAVALSQSKRRTKKQGARMCITTGWSDSESSVVQLISIRYWALRRVLLFWDLLR